MKLVLIQSNSRGAGHKNVRFSLMKPQKTFDHGIPALAQSLRKLAV